jgi:hypothetical protein
VADYETRRRLRAELDALDDEQLGDEAFATRQAALTRQIEEIDRQIKHDEIPTTYAECLEIAIGPLLDAVRRGDGRAEVRFLDIIARGIERRKARRKRRDGDRRLAEGRIAAG